MWRSRRLEVFEVRDGRKTPVPMINESRVPSPEFFSCFRPGVFWRPLILALVRRRRVRSRMTAWSPINRASSRASLAIIPFSYPICPVPKQDPPENSEAPIGNCHHSPSSPRSQGTPLFGRTAGPANGRRQLTKATKKNLLGADRILKSYQLTNSCIGNLVRACVMVLFYH
jgi:hypothetical protein